VTHAVQLPDAQRGCPLSTVFSEQKQRQPATASAGRPLRATAAVAAVPSQQQVRQQAGTVSFTAAPTQPPASQPFVQLGSKREWDSVAQQGCGSYLCACAIIGLVSSSQQNTHVRRWTGAPPRPSTTAAAASVAAGLHLNFLSSSSSSCCSAAATATLAAGTSARVGKALRSRAVSHISVLAHVCSVIYLYRSL
jgi:hypothetical protein